MAVDACFLFRGDIRFDTRMANMVGTYLKRGGQVTVIQGGDEDRSYDYHGARVISFRNKESGPFGFFKFWMRASQLALRVRAQVFWACDLYALPVALWRAKLLGVKSGYDSRELFAHLGALKSSRLKQKFWYGLEKKLIGRVDMVVTSGDMDSDYIEERYHIRRPVVIRNVPPFTSVARSNRLRNELGISDAMPVCVYQGVMVEGRGIGITIELAALMPDVAFVFIGDGALAQTITHAATTQKNIYHIPKVNKEELLSYAASATLGLALIEPITLSYLLALPNKLFEYIMAGTPVVVSCAPQMERIVDEYGVGITVPFDCMGDIHAAVRTLLDSPDALKTCAKHCIDATRELCWEQEERNFVAFAHTEGLL